MRVRRARAGQATAEVVVLIAFLAVALAGVAYAIVPGFQEGVNGLAGDVGTLLNGPSGGRSNKR
jgi:hypothetical protein